jgi:hypothetical protein
MIWKRRSGFTRTALGFPKMDSPPEVAFFTLNGTWLGLYGREVTCRRCRRFTRMEVGFLASRFLTTWSLRRTLIKSLNKAVSTGAQLVKSPRKASWGGYNGYFKDPDGYLWEIAYNPFFWVGPEDKKS